MQFHSYLSLDVIYIFLKNPLAEISLLIISLFPDETQQQPSSRPEEDDQGPGLTMAELNNYPWYV